MLVSKERWNNLHVEKVYPFEIVRTEIWLW